MQVELPLAYNKKMRWYEEICNNGDHRGLPRLGSAGEQVSRFSMSHPWRSNVERALICGSDGKWWLGRKQRVAGGSNVRLLDNRFPWDVHICTFATVVLLSFVILS